MLNVLEHRWKQTLRNQLGQPAKEKADVKILLFSTTTYWKDIKITEPDSSQKCTLKGKDAAGRSRYKQEIKIWYKERIPHCATGWSENLWNLHCLETFKFNWKMPWATCSGWTFPEHGVGLNDLQRLPFNPRCSMIRWHYEQCSKLKECIPIPSNISRNWKFIYCFLYHYRGSLTFLPRKWIHEYILETQKPKKQKLWESISFAKDWKVTQSSWANVAID